MMANVDEVNHKTTVVQPVKVHELYTTQSLKSSYKTVTRKVSQSFSTFPSVNHRACFAEREASG
jgi:hypothetical protein